MFETLVSKTEQSKYLTLIISGDKSRHLIFTVYTKS